LAEYRDRPAELAALGIGVVALSVDDPPRSASVRSQLGLPFPILCDPRREIVKEWGLYNPEERGGIALPAVFVIDRDRRVVYRSVDRTQSRVSTASLLAFLRARAAGAQPVAPAQVPVRFPGLGFALRGIINMVRHGSRTPVG
jgi:peroxiredoxin Q/BCP